VCDAALDVDLEWRLVRCQACRALLLSRRADDGGGPGRAYVLRGVRPRTPWRRVTVPWDTASTTRLRSWLVAATLLTFALAVALLGAAWLLR
jgi:hypothetical protein